MAHRQKSKNVFYEESSHIPLILSFGGKLAPNTVVDALASHIDVMATVLDYVLDNNNANDGFTLQDLDHSDGTSLRRFVEGQPMNEHYDENVVVSEFDYRQPTKVDVENYSHKRRLYQGKYYLARKIDSTPNFMIRHGSHKLMMHKLASSDKTDMLFDLAEDPMEIHN